jgi:hypothetical protein
MHRAKESIFFSHETEYAMSLKSGDPFATPISAVANPKPSMPSQLQSMSVKKQSPMLEKPNYQSLVAEMQAEPPSQLPTIEEEDVFPIEATSPPPAPSARLSEKVALSEPTEPYPPPRFVQSPHPVAAAPASSPPPIAPITEKSGLIEKNKNLIILLIVTAAILKFAAPRLRVYPRFVSNSELGLNLVGIVAVSVLIVLAYKLVTSMAGISD